MLLVLLLINSALAFGPRSTTSDPASQIERYFTDRTQSVHDNLRDWPSAADVRTRWLAFQATIRDSRFVACQDRICAAARRDFTQWMNWDLWYQLNLEAAELWQDLVSCTPDQDPEAARISYYSAKSLCPKDEGASRAIESRIRALHGRVRDFMGSTAIHAPDKFNDSEAIRAIRRTIPFHPLFVQTVLEYGSTVARFHYRYFNTWGELSYESAWIDSPYSRTFGDRIESIIGGRGDQMSETFRQARAYLNLHLILDLLPKFSAEDSPPWGLWQKPSYLLANLMGQQILLSHRSRSSAIVPGGERSAFSLTYGLTLASDAIWAFEENVPPLLRRHREGVITEFRAMAERYGMPTDRRKYCGKNWEKTPVCFAIDPSNPNETMADF